ncbi:MAG: hypothetical protein LBE21_11105 [Pseudomonadales bacterium]|nr:hypothetical protein [Pseudomonadales bacterium]
MLQQINISYVPEQDRLLLKARQEDETEYRVWFTRRFTALLLNVLREHMAPHGGQTQLAASRETVQQLKGGAFQSPYREQQPATLPFGTDGILGYRINHSVANDVTRLQLLPKEGEGLSLSLNKHMLYMLYSLLEQTLPQTGWELGEVPVPKQLLH